MILAAGVYQVAAGVYQAPLLLFTSIAMAVMVMSSEEIPASLKRRTKLLLALSSVKDRIRL